MKTFLEFWTSGEYAPYQQKAGKVRSRTVYSKIAKVFVTRNITLTVDDDLLASKEGNTPYKTLQTLGINGENPSMQMESWW